MRQSLICVMLPQENRQFDTYNYNPIRRRIEEYLSVERYIFHVLMEFPLAWQLYTTNPFFIHFKIPICSAYIPFILLNSYICLNIQRCGTKPNIRFDISWFSVHNLMVRRLKVENASLLYIYLRSFKPIVIARQKLESRDSVRYVDEIYLKLYVKFLVTFYENSKKMLKLYWMCAFAYVFF